MKHIGLEALLDEAKEFEKKYEWLQAAKYYREASKTAFYEKDVIKIADLNENVGFCFYRAALQAKSNTEFRKLLKCSIQSFEMEIKNLEGVNELQLEQKYAKAMTYYVRSWLENIPSEKKKLLEKWWSLKKQLVDYFEKSGDLHSAGRVCNDLIEYSGYDFWWLVSDFFEAEMIFKEAINFGEKAIQILSQQEEKYELARAYIFTSWYLGFSNWYLEDENRTIEYTSKCQDYANKALKLSQELGNALLISRAYNVAWNAAQMLNEKPTTAIKFGKKMLKFGEIAKDNYLIGFGNILTGYSTFWLANIMENPDRQKESFERVKNLAKKATYHFKIINQVVGFYLSYPCHSSGLMGLASIETDIKKKEELLEKAKGVCVKGIELLKDWRRLVGNEFGTLSSTLHTLADLKNCVEDKEATLKEAKRYAEKSIKWQEEFTPFAYEYLNSTYYNLAIVQEKIAQLSNNDLERGNLLNNSITSIKKSVELVEKKKKIYTQSSWGIGFYFGLRYYKFGEILQEFSSISKEKEIKIEAIQALRKALSYFTEADISTYVGESHWKLAQLYEQLNDFGNASENYEMSAESFHKASKKIPQLKKFYANYSFYMQAWSQIEQARYSHSIEEYAEAQQHYEKAAKLHESTDSWNYLSSNYFAWANMEEAESLSRIENAQQAKAAFQKALEQFTVAQESIKQEIGRIASKEERAVANRLFQASNLRRRFCQARIQIEEAKILDREGKYLQSSKSYGQAGREIESIINKVESETERRELELIAILCQAWGKMSLAEGKSSPEVFLEAANLFEEAKNLSLTEKTSLWALANSSFCKGLAARTQFQSTFDKTYHSMAKKQVEQASDYYRRAGFETASEYAKATQRLLDAYVYINSAQEEVDPEKKTKFYQLAEQLLQIAAGLFVKAKQSEKTALVQSILTTVREEKALAASLNDVMHAPTIASTTLSFTAPSPTSEVSVGLESFEHANVQANLVTHIKEVRVGESFCLSVEFVNAGKEPALLTRVEDFVPPDFIVVKKPEIYRLEESCLNMKGKQIAPLKLVEAKVVLQPSKKGVYQLKPTVHYLDELGQSKSLKLKSVEINVEEVILANRVSTGTKELDSLLLGGIPEEYAVVLTGSPSDERELLINNFLEAGVKEGQTSFYVTTEAVGVESLLDKSGFYLFLCNPKPKVEVPDLPNVYKLRGKNLTNLNIDLLKAYRNVAQSSGKRVVVEIVSDVLVDYGLKMTRQWITELTTDLVSKGFTVLAVMNPEMHPSDQATGVVDIFDGEISLFQTVDTLECRKSLRIKKLRNQDYIKNPICFS